MRNSPTLKALLSTVLTFAFIVGVGAFTSAIGQNTSSQPTAPAANPYKNVQSESAAAAHNTANPHRSTTGAVHNAP